MQSDRVLSTLFVVFAGAGGGYWTVYRDDWCGSNSAQLHEVGHNFGFGHSGEGTSEYGDGVRRRAACSLYSDAEDGEPYLPCFVASCNAHACVVELTFVSCTFPQQRL